MVATVENSVGEAVYYSVVCLKIRDSVENSVELKNGTSVTSFW